MNWHSFRGACHLVYEPSLSWRIRPYAKLGGGVVYEEKTENGLKSYNTKALLKTGLGLKCHLTKGLSVSGEAVYWTNSLVSIDFGLAYHF